MATIQPKTGSDHNELWSKLPHDLAHGRVLSLEQAAAYCGVSIATFERLLAAGQGPQVCKLSERRRGCRLKHLDVWLEQRAGAGEAA